MDTPIESVHILAILTVKSEQLNQSVWILTKFVLAEPTGQPVARRWGTRKFEIEDKTLSIIIMSVPQDKVMGCCTENLNQNSMMTKSQCSC
jgi:hypothetical protein